MAESREMARTIAYNITMIITKKNLLNDTQKITRATLARMTGLSCTSITNIMAGKSMPTIPHLNSIAKALEVSTEELLTKVDW